MRPRFIRRPPDTVIVGIGRRASVRCHVEAIPPAVIHWSRQNSDKDVTDAVSVLSFYIGLALISTLHSIVVFQLQINLSYVGLMFFIYSLNYI